MTQLERKKVETFISLHEGNFKKYRDSLEALYSETDWSDSLGNQVDREDLEYRLSLANKSLSLRRAT